MTASYCSFSACTSAVTVSESSEGWGAVPTDPDRGVGNLSAWHRVTKDTLDRLGDAGKKKETNKIIYFLYLPSLDVSLDEPLR